MLITLVGLTTVIAAWDIGRRQVDRALGRAEFERRLQVLETRVKEHGDRLTRQALGTEQPIARTRIGR